MLEANIIKSSIGYAEVFVSQLSFLLSIIIGIFAAYFVFKVSRKMGGGLFGPVLSFISFGIMLIVIGAISVALASEVTDIWLWLGRTMFFALGFVFLAIGANKLLKGVTNY